ncbi:NAD-dependent succinate-semialdehyde dehydrogenase [Bacteroidota bacterium]
MPITSVNPFNNQLIKEFKEYSDTEIEAVVGAVAHQFHEWKSVSFDERASLMRNCSEILKKDCHKLALMITEEMGKLIGESEAEINKCAWVCDYYAENAFSFLKNETLPVNEARSYIAYDPLGVILAVMPWNFPFWQVFRFLAPALMAGNVGLLKHASNVPQCALAIEDTIRKAGFPQNVFRTLLIGSGKVNKVIDDERIVAVTLTGSELAGQEVAERAGRNIKKLVLELGGSDPFIVLKDADIEEAVKIAVLSRMINCGQSCIAAKRFIIEKDIENTFIELYKNEILKLSAGDPVNPDTNLAPLARPDLVSDLERQVVESINLGAELVTGGKRILGEGNFYQPTILKNVQPGMPAFDEELFGPVIPIITALDEMEAIKLANKSRYGLGAAIWTRDINKGEKLARMVESGSVFINSMVASHPKVPFGGVKMSGYGRELSHLGIREFMNTKSVWVNG